VTLRIVVRRELLAAGEKPTLVGRNAAEADHWGWITQAWSDAELDGFVDTMAARLASFGREFLASARAVVNRAPLPPDADSSTSQIAVAAAGFEPDLRGS
jgi:hypothetical protein